MRLQLVAYDVAGSRRGVIPPGLSLTRYLTLGEAPTLQAEFTGLQGRLDDLQGPVEVAFQYSNQSEDWVEPPNGRFIIDSDDFDRLDRGQLVHRFSFLGIVNALKYADVGTASLNADGQRKFTNVTPGAMMATLIGEAKGGGLLTPLDIDFSSSTTSDGDAWTRTLSRTLDPSNDLLGLLVSLYEGGLCDYWTEGRTLRMANPGTALARDKSTGSNPVYLRDQGLTGSPENVAYGDIITKVRVLGDNGSRWTFTNVGAVSAFGPRIQTLSGSGVTSTATAQSYADEALRAGQNPARSLTREWTVLDSTPFVPDRDFRLGDWIKADTAEQIGERMRVVATSLREEQGQTVAFVTLGSRRLSLLLRVSKRIGQVPKQIGDGGGGLGSPGSPGNWDPSNSGDPLPGGGDSGTGGTGGGGGGGGTGVGNMIAWYKDVDGTWPPRPSTTPPPGVVVQWIGVDPPPLISGDQAMNGDLYLQTDF